MSLAMSPHPSVLPTYVFGPAPSCMSRVCKLPRRPALSFFRCRRSHPRSCMHACTHSLASCTIQLHSIDTLHGIKHRHRHGRATLPVHALCAPYSCAPPSSFSPLIYLRHGAAVASELCCHLLCIDNRQACSRYSSMSSSYIPGDNSCHKWQFVNYLFH